MLSLRKKTTQFFISVAIRQFALGMIFIFEPIYLFLYFGKSLPLTLLFFALIHGLFGLLAVYGGKIMAKIGFDRAMLISHFFFFGYYLSLFFLYKAFFFLVLAIILKSLGMTFYWPSFHTDFARFSERDHRGQEVGELNVASSTLAFFSPIVGGLILTAFNYQILFIIVLIVLLTSSIPLFLSKEKQEVYTDTYEKAWQRIFKKENRKTSLAFAAQGIETGINAYLWPLFMFVLAIQYSAMGGITSFALGISLLFALYIGKITDTMNRAKLLNIGSVLTSISWFIKYFVVSPFGAFLAQTFYRISKTSASIPFRTILYERAALQKREADEFIIYREITHNISRSFALIILAGIFFLFPKINISFIIASIFSLGIMFLGKSSLSYKPQ